MIFASAFAWMIATALTPPVAQAPPAIVLAGDAGATAYSQHCAACHGADLRGGPNAPSLRGVGAADLDFWMTTGRMPAAVPWLQVMHRGAQLSSGEIAAIERYVVSIAPGGPAIPQVVANGDATHGAALFQEECMHCHGVDADGAAIGGSDWAPPLHRATVLQVAEAIRVGPGLMPAFGERQLTPRDVDDIATFLSQARAAGGAHSLPLETSGPVPEGLLGWLAAALLTIAAYAFSVPRKNRQTKERIS